MNSDSLVFSVQWILMVQNKSLGPKGSGPSAVTDACEPFSVLRTQPPWTPHWMYGIFGRDGDCWGYVGLKKMAECFQGWFPLMEAEPQHKYFPGWVGACELSIRTHPAVEVLMGGSLGSVPGSPPFHAQWELVSLLPSSASLGSRGQESDLLLQTECYCSTKVNGHLIPV